MIRLIPFFVLALVSCLSNAEELPYKKFLVKNMENISKVTAGMTKEQVMSVMGSDTSRVHSEKLNNPYKTDFLKQDAETYEVLRFLTRPHPPFTSILDNQSTPVVFKNGVVTGVGRDALRLVKSE